MIQTKTKVPRNTVKKAKKSPAKKSSLRVKKTSLVIPVLPKKSPNTFTKTHLSHFVRDMLPRSFQKRPTFSVREDIFTTIIAVIIACIVIAIGFLYAVSRTTSLSAKVLPVRHIQQTQKIRISSSVKLTPEVLLALETILPQIRIETTNTLTQVFYANDAGLPIDLAEYFGTSIQEGDMVLQFSTSSILYRPSEKMIIKTRIRQ